MEAEREIGILAYSALFLAEDTGLLSILTDRAEHGVKVHIALGDPGSSHVAERGRQEAIGDALAAKAQSAITLLDPLRALPNIEIRAHQAILYNSIYRADGRLLVNPYVYGLPASQAPVLDLQQTDHEGLTDAYLTCFTTVWDQAAILPL